MSEIDYQDYYRFAILKLCSDNDNDKIKMNK